jgi:hypothetical protein
MGLMLVPFRGRLHAIRIKSENSGLGCEISIA